MTPDDLLAALAHVAPTAVFFVGIMLLSQIFLWFYRSMKRERDRNWAAAWRDATACAKAAGVPFTLEDSPASIYARIEWAREKRLRDSIEKHRWLK